MRWLFLSTAILFICSPVRADLVVDVNLGVLSTGTSMSVTGNTTGAANEASNYAPFTNPAVTWLEDVVYQFTVNTPFSYQLLINSIAGDCDYFLTDTLVTNFDGTHNNPANTLAADFLDGGLDGAVLLLPAGTYYIVCDAFGGALPGNSAANVGPFDVQLVIAPPPIVSSLGNLPLDDGFYARGQTGPADHPYGELEFTVDTTGSYDIQADWIDPINGTFDGYLYLFDAPFNQNDSTNIAFDDDFNGLLSSLIVGVALNSGQSYYLVGTSFAGIPAASGLSGDVTVFGPGMASLAGGGECAFEIGDVNHDGSVGLTDVQAFVDSLVGGPGAYVCEADIDQNGEVSLLDVNPFVALITGG